jgi:hypothetical protein
MGDLQIFSSAGTDDSPQTVTSTGSTYGRVEDLFATLVSIAAIQTDVATNRAEITAVTHEAPEDFDTLKEISGELDDDALQDFLTALG